MRSILLAAVSSLALAGCANLPFATAISAPPAPVTASAADVVTEDAIEAHIRFLADDLLEGRDTGSRGYDIAALYVESQYRLLGLLPGGHDGFQDAVPLQTMTPVTEASHMSIDGEALAFGDDFILSASSNLDSSSVSGEAVFVGYGIDAPSLGISDYDAIDVEGRIVIVLSGTPAGLPSDVSAHLNSTRTKAQTAADHGASGILLIAAEGLTRFPFERMRPRAGMPSVSIVETAPSSVAVSGVIPASTAERLFANEADGFAAVLEAARDGEPLTPRPLGVTVELAQETTREPIISHNVIGILPGSDPELAAESVVITAHLDHIGVCQPLSEEDRICNGALDNASGTAIMLETARALAAGPRPRRSVVFIALTAEEKGLLGSAHIAANPTEAMGTMVANVNLDMPVIRYEFNDLIAFGAEHSVLGPLAEAAARRAGASISPDPIPQQSLFVRSDHYNFVRQGIPSIFLMTGFSSPDAEDDEGQGFLRFLGGDYHAPGDDLMGGIRFDQGAKFARINFEIIQTLANADETPAWNDDSFFGATFAGD